MLTYTIPAGFKDTSDYRFLSRKREREYWVERTEGSAAVDFQERSLLLSLEKAATQIELSGGRAKLSTNKDGSLLLKVKPERRGKAGKDSRGDFVIRAAVKCFAPGVAIRLFAMSENEDAKEFKAALHSMRQVPEDQAALVRIEQPDDPTSKWLPAGPVELKLSADYEMNVPVVRVEKEGKQLEFTRTTVPQGAIETEDWPLADRVGWVWPSLDGTTYFEIDDAPPGLVETESNPATVEKGPGDLKLIYSSFDKPRDRSETKNLVEQIHVNVHKKKK